MKGRRSDDVLKESENIRDVELLRGAIEALHCRPATYWAATDVRLERPKSTHTVYTFLLKPPAPSIVAFAWTEGQGDAGTSLGEISPRRIVLMSDRVRSAEDAVRSTLRRKRVTPKPR